jgi:hypothetical protein
MLGGVACSEQDGGHRLGAMLAAFRASMCWPNQLPFCGSNIRPPSAGRCRDLFIPQHWTPANRSHASPEREACHPRPHLRTTSWTMPPCRSLRDALFNDRKLDGVRIRHRPEIRLPRKIEVRVTNCSRLQCECSTGGTAKVLRGFLFCMAFCLAACVHDFAPSHVVQGSQMHTEGMAYDLDSACCLVCG